MRRSPPFLQFSIETEEGAHVTSLFFSQLSPRLGCSACHKPQQRSHSCVSSWLLLRLLTHQRAPGIVEELDDLRQVHRLASPSPRTTLAIHFPSQGPVCVQYLGIGCSSQV